MHKKGVFSSIATMATVSAIFIHWFLFRKRQIQSTPTHTNINNNTKSSTTDSAVARGVYEVFLSFCGKDTRKGFTDFLYTDLIAAGIQTFRDDNELRVGEEISVELLKSINESTILIPIFSKNYASSKWCLLELEQMVDCYKNGGKMIYPLFYDVDPSDVRNQRGSYATAFRRYNKKFSGDVVRRWRNALKMVGELKGMELMKETNGHEGEFVKLVVHNVLLELAKNYKHVPENLVGMDNHIKELMGLLEVDSKDVRFVGIHGMGGLGKTTIAKVIYNKLCERFEGHCFLDNIRENLKDIVELQKQFISKILNKIAFESFTDNNQGRERIKDVVFGKKLLIVLDDVGSNFQVDKLIGHQSWFGIQSRIILTTRDKDVLDVIELNCQSEDPCVVYKNYNPELMNNRDSLQLFSKHAFKRDSPIEGYDILSKEVISIAAGLPLVLVVLGSTFFSIKDKDIWEEKLIHLRNIPNKDVMEKLKFSFEALENSEKQIFLDIACFFIGYRKTRPCYMWESCGFYPRIGISVLVNRSLISVDDDDVLRMHDQLRDLGRQIVREEGLRNGKPGEQSRLWYPEEAMHVLETRQGTSSVKALCLKYHSSVVASHFNNLPNLRYLSMSWKNSVDGDFKHLLPSLRWLHCIDLMKFSPTNLNMKNLVVLHLSDAKLTDDWDGWNRLKAANNLKVLDLSSCKGFTTLPNLSNLTKLVELKLSRCNNLTGLEGLEKLESLQVLDITWCYHLVTLPNISNLKKLKVLKAPMCSGLIRIDGVQEYISLEVLDLKGCHLVTLPNISNLNMLQVLKAPGLDTTDFSSLKKLKELYIYGNNGIEIQGIAKLESLKFLGMEYCRCLERLPALPNFGTLKHIYVSKCVKLQDVEGLGVIESLEILEISSCVQLQKLPDLHRLKRLTELRIEYLEDLTEILGLEELRSLNVLSIIYCHSIEKLPDLSTLENLKSLDVMGCANLSEILEIKEWKSLTYLHIPGCYKLQYLPDLPNVTIDRRRYHGFP